MSGGRDRTPSRSPFRLQERLKLRPSPQIESRALSSAASSMSTVRQILSLQKPSELALRTVFTPRAAKPQAKSQKAIRPPKVKRIVHRPKKLAKNGLINTQSIAGLCITGISVKHKSAPKKVTAKKPAKLRTIQKKLPRVKEKRPRLSAATNFRLNDGSKKRPPEVVNEQLMDDVLQYLAPTLEKYKGCIILDMHPGSCLWSRRVHEFLKPKCHVLLEPEEQYKEHIDELVNSSDSTYKHLPLSPSSAQSVNATYSQLFDEDGLIPRPRLASDDPFLLKTDHSLLVIGSLNRRDNLSYYGRSKSGSLWAGDTMSWAALENKFMHRHGPVRMLLWVPEQDRGIYLPEQTIHSTEKQASMGLAMNVQAVVEVERVQRKLLQEEWSTTSRWSGLHLAREQLVSSKMSQAGMRIPEGRQTRRMVRDGLASPKHAPKSPLEIRYQTLEEVEVAFAELEQKWNDFLIQVATSGLQTSAAYSRSTLADVYPQLTHTELADALLENPSKSHRSLMRARARKEQGIKPGDLSYEEARDVKLPSKRPDVTHLTGADVRTALFADYALRGINIEMHCKILEEDGHDVTELKKRVIQFQDGIIANCTPIIDEYERHVEDWMSFFQSSPVLTVDRRQYEPLKASPTDFWPQHNLNLLDFTPTNRDFNIPGLADRGKTAAVCKDLMTFLFMYKGQSVVHVLERLAPNAATDLICQVPAMTDPRKGGRLDPKYLKVRHLTAEMLEGLTKAWCEWPFRPEGWEFLVHSKSGDNSVSHATPEAVTAVDDSEGHD